MYIEPTIKKLIDNIVLADNLSAKEKLNKLDELKKGFIDLIEENKDKIKSDYDYCPKCKNYYKKEYFNIFYKDRKFIYNNNPNSWEPEERIINSKFKECPTGHIFLVD